MPLRKLVIYVKEVGDPLFVHRNFESIKEWLTAANGLESTIKTLEAETATLQAQVKDLLERVTDLENP